MAKMVRIGDYLLPEEEVNRRLRTTHPCARCGGPRFFSSRLRDDDLCGPCAYKKESMTHVACTCDRSVPLTVSNACHSESCPRFWLDLQCANCTQLLERDDSTPPCVIENGIAHTWCGEACADVWMNDPAHPERKVGWVRLSDLTPEQANELLSDVGLALDGVGDRKPS